MLPHLNLEADLSELPRFLDRYALLEAEMAVGLVRAARLFQQAIWTADADANLAWILLVSSLEAAAASWGGRTKEDPLKEIEANWTELGELLGEVAGHDLALSGRLSKLLRGHVKMQRRVKGFVSEYCPVAPEPRPSFDVVDWEPGAIVESLGPIYNWRSRFLHDAIPFPGAMCEPPRKDKVGAFSECPGGLGTGIGDATWLAEDTPMLLWPFAYLVNEVLRSWWLGET
jgi:hypothetical protein